LNPLNRLAETLNLTFPTSWAELSQRQLLHVFTCIAAGYTPIEVKVCALVRFNKLDVRPNDIEHTYTLRKDGKEYAVTSEQIAAVLSGIDFISQIPSVPVHLNEIKGNKALPADFQEVPFEKFIMCDNFYQGYLHTGKPECINDLAGILYDFKQPFCLTRAQEISIFYWWTSLKRYFGNMFPNFFKTVSSEDQAFSQNLYRHLSDSMNAQIRALTKGDITKEKEVLSMDTWRALTELDAQAREYDELQRSCKH